MASGVWVWRTSALDLSLGLVVGDHSCLVIDTGVDSEHGYEFARAVREITPLPWQVVYTHDHYDHWFGTEAFGETKVWAVGAVDTYLSRGRLEREKLSVRYRKDGEADKARRLGRTRLVPPNSPLVGTVPVDLGGRTVVLRQAGFAHSDNDAVVEVSDASVLFAGDLFEAGADPSFSDAHPQQWAAVADYLLSWKPQHVVPGHGDPQDYWWARRQARDFAEAARLAHEVRTGLITADEAAAHAPFSEATMRTVIARTAEFPSAPPAPAPEPQIHPAPQPPQVRPQYIEEIWIPPFPDPPERN